MVCGGRETMCRRHGAVGSSLPPTFLLSPGPIVLRPLPAVFAPAFVIGSSIRVTPSLVLLVVSVCVVYRTCFTAAGIYVVTLALSFWQGKVNTCVENEATKAGDYE
jgi:ABC-type uncharacterized transport system permease subunit